jgi:hypothetical protein
MSDCCKLILKLLSSLLLCCVQGMNFLAGLLLLAVDKDCTKTFWLLVVLLEQVTTCSTANHHDVANAAIASMTLTHKQHCWRICMYCCCCQVLNHKA